MLWYFLAKPNYLMARSEYPWIYFLIGVLFFNTTHVFITFIKLYCFPEFRKLSFLSSKTFKLRCLAIFGCTFALTFLASYFVRESLAISVLLRVFIFATTIHHTNMQTYGLSSQLDLSGRSNRIEKWFVLAFTIASFPVYALARVQWFFTDLNTYKIFLELEHEVACLKVNF